MSVTLSVVQMYSSGIQKWPVECLGCLPSESLLIIFGLHIKISLIFLDAIYILLQIFAPVKHLFWWLPKFDCEHLRFTREIEANTPVVRSGQATVNWSGT